MSDADLDHFLAAIRHALQELGYEEIYYCASLSRNGGRDVLIWITALKGKFEGGRSFEKSDWDRLLGDSMVLCNVFPGELVESFPDAKMILSVRDN